MILTVDLASKYSAAILRDSDGKVYHQFDSGGQSALHFADQVASAEKFYDPEVVLIEDVPYGISSQSMTKPVLRLQGAIIHAMATELDKVLWINPSTWQKAYPGVGTAPKGMAKAAGAAFRIQAALDHAERLGYTPPDLVAAYIESLPEGTKVLKKHTSPLEKTMTDYVDAFLMNHWAHEHIETLFDMTGVQKTFI